MKDTVGDETTPAARSRAPAGGDPVGQEPAPLLIRHAGRLELLALPAGAHAEVDPAADSTSSVATALARTTAGRIGATRIPVPSRRRVGHGGDGAEHDHRVEPRRVDGEGEVHRVRVGVRAAHDVLGHDDPVEAGLLGPTASSSTRPQSPPGHPPNVGSVTVSVGAHRATVEGGGTVP